MLARFCLLKPHTTTFPASTDTSKERMLYECASLCVSTAMQFINLITENNSPSSLSASGINIIPWWHRIFYLHVASMIIIAASLRADLFTSSVAQSWDKAMDALKEHENLSPFVAQCVGMFQGLRERIREMHLTKEDETRQAVGEEREGEAGEANPTSYFQDAFHDIGFDPDNFLFGKEDLSWLSNFEALI